VASCTTECEEDRYGTHYLNITPVVFHNCLVMLAVFGIYFWVHTCHFHLHIAGWVGLLSHLSFHSLLGGACASLVGSSVTLQGVAATLTALLIIARMCRCHPYSSHFVGVLPPPPFYARVHPTTCSPIYCQ